MCDTIVSVRPALLTLWLLIVLAAVVACGGSDAAAPSLTMIPATATYSPDPTPTASTSPTPEPTPEPTPAPAPPIDLTASQPRSGGILFVRFPFAPAGLRAATVELN